MHTQFLLIWPYSGVTHVQKRTLGITGGAFLQARCPSHHPTNSAEALKGTQGTVAYPGNFTPGSHLS